MALFDIPRPAGVDTASVAQKVKNSKRKVATTTRKTGNTILDRINLIRAKVQEELGKYGDKYIVIRTEEELTTYIDACVANGIVALDTETTSLDTILSEVAGVSLFTPGQKACYIPLNHKSYVDNLRIENQIDISVAKAQLERLINVKQIMHNGKFDINVCVWQLDIDYSTALFWDTMIASKIFNETEPAGLKVQHAMKVQKAEKINDYSSLFEGITFDMIPISIGYLYAARDAEMTYELYQYQLEQYLKPENKNLYELLTVIENPLVKVIAKMQRVGIAVNLETFNQLSIKYNKVLEEVQKNFDYLCNEVYAPSIAKYNKKTIKKHLISPINPGSPDQVATLLFDALEITHPDKRNKDNRGTGADVLKEIDHPVAQAVLEYRTVQKLLSTYIDKMPKMVNPKTGKIHASFNQTGTETGRLSSNDPNLQNIPSKNEEIRTGFVADKDCVFTWSDYSQQEPKVTAHLAQDKTMIQNYMEGKDGYAVIASKVFHVDYFECLEHRQDGTYNAEGKKRRGKAKVIQLAGTYGQQAYTLAKDLGIPVKDAKQIQDDFFNAFPGIKKLTEKLFQFAFENGYIETVWGRRRHLPDMMLEPYEFSWIDGVSTDTDLLDFASESVVGEVPNDLCLYYMEAMDKCYGFKQKAKVLEHARKDNIKIVDNTRKIADAERQTINTPIQGTSADMVKLAMVNLYNDEEFNKLGGIIVLQVHDELCCMWPKDVWQQGVKVVERVMVDSPTTKIAIPLTVDTVACTVWNGEELEING